MSKSLSGRMMFFLDPFLSCFMLYSQIHISQIILLISRAPIHGHAAKM